MRHSIRFVLLSLLATGCAATDETDASHSDVTTRDVRDAQGSDTAPLDVPAIDATDTHEISAPDSSDSPSALDAPADVMDVPTTDVTDAAALDVAIDVVDAPDVVTIDAVDVPLDTTPDVPAVDTGPDVSGPVGIGTYTYTAVPPAMLINPPAAAFHPNGSYALIPSDTDRVYRYDPVTFALTQVASEGSTVVWRNVVFTPDGSQAVLLANVAGTGRVYVWDDAAGTLTEMMSERFAGTYESIAWSHDGTTARLLGWTMSGGAYIARLWTFSTTTGRSGALAFATSAGCQDLAWATDAFDRPALAVVCGLNGVTLFHIDGDGTMIASPSSAGNTSRIAARPTGEYALAIGWSGQRVYRFQQGNWMTAFASPTFPGIYTLGFSSDGRRALILGGRSGTGTGQVYEYRHDMYSMAAITDVSIPGFSGPPYNAETGTRLNAVAWRPGCEGGIIVGGQDTFSVRRGLLIRFANTDGIACP